MGMCLIVERLRRRPRRRKGWDHGRYWVVVEAVVAAPEVAAAAGFVGEVVGDAAVADVADAAGVVCRSVEGGGKFGE